MQILNVASPLLASVMISELKDVSADGGTAYGSFVMDQYEKCMGNLNFLSFPEEIVSEAKYVLSVFVDEKMMVACRSWELLQMKYYSSNCGGEEFFQRLSALLDRFSVMDSGSPELLELYNVLLAAGFRGSYWNDRTGAIADLRRKINKILQIPSSPVLVNQTDEQSSNRSMTYFDRRTLVAALLMILVSVVLVVCLNDYISHHAVVWNSIFDMLESGSKLQLMEVMKQ